MKKSFKTICSIAMGIVGIFLIWFLLFGGADDALENMEKGGDVGAEAPSDSFDIYEYEMDDDNVVDVAVPKYISEYILGELENEQASKLLYSLHVYPDASTTDELIEMSHPVQIPTETDFIDIVNEPFNVGEAFWFDIRVDFIGVLDTFNGVVQGDDTAPETAVNVSFTGDKKIVAGNTVSVIAIYAGLDEGTPTFIALNLD